MNRKILPGVLALSSVAAILLYQPAVHAFSWTESAATLHSGDQAGTSFTTYFFDGYGLNYGHGNNVLIPGLTSEAVFTLVDDFNGGPSAKFNVTLKNTSDSNLIRKASISSLKFLANGGQQVARNLNIGLTPNSKTFETTLNFNAPISSFSLSDFKIKYKSILAKNGQYYKKGKGDGTVPTPALLPGLIGMGVAAFRKKKKVGVDSDTPETVTG